MPVGSRVTRSNREEGVTPSVAGDYRCPWCGERISQPPKGYDWCPKVGALNAQGDRIGAHLVAVGGSVPAGV